MYLEKHHLSTLFFNNVYMAITIIIFTISRPALITHVHSVGCHGTMQVREWANATSLKRTQSKIAIQDFIFKNIFLNMFFEKGNWVYQNCKKRSLHIMNIRTFLRIWYPQLCWLSTVQASQKKQTWRTYYHFSRHFALICCNIYDNFR